MKLLAAILLVIFWLMTLVLGISIIGWLVLAIADEKWFGYGKSLMNILEVGKK